MNELSHYGVKGMKWGVRRDNPSGGSGSGGSTSQPRASAEATATAKTAAKADMAGGLHVLSNQELQQAITRMNLESQYRNLTTRNQSELDRGIQTAEKLLKIGGTVEKARKFLNTPTGKAVKTGLTGAFAAATAYATGGTSAAAGAGASVVIRKMSNHYTNVGN